MQGKDTIYQDIEVLQSIVRNSVDGLLIVDSARTIQFSNPIASTQFESSNGDLIGTTYNHPLLVGQTHEIEIKRRNGKAGTGEVRVSDFTWKGNKAHLVSIRDITERIVFDRLKDDFIRTVSHELRTPLTSTREALSVLKDGILGDVNDQQQDFLGLCLRNTDLLKRIVSDLLDISKIEAGQVKLSKEKIDFIDMLQSTVETFGPVIESKDLVLNLDLPEGPFYIYADNDRITQVINNLIGNALKFTKEGSISVSVKIQDDDLLCSIEDTGRGISDEDLPHVFEKFEQFGEVIDVENRGTGLGLAISKEIVELHGGQIQAESSLGQGSVFTVTLPAYNDSTELYDAVKHRIRSTKEPFLLFSLQLPDDKTSEKIDFQNLRAKIRFVLEEAGHHVTPVNDGSPFGSLLIERIPNANFDPARLIIRTVKGMLIDAGVEGEPEICTKMARYPHEAQSVEALIQAFEKSQVSEKQERLTKTVFIVDDEEEITEALNTLLNIFGYEKIHRLHSGDEVFEKLATTVPDLIIQDMHLPGMSGYEIIGRLKEKRETQDIPILIMSGYEVETQYFTEYLDKKVILTVNKPIKAELLKKLVYYLL